MKKILFFLVFSLLSSFIYAQQLPIYSQYLLSTFMINPAIAGSDGYSSINITSRKQWVGLDGSPQINSISFQSRFIKNGYSIKNRKSGRNVLRPQTDGKVGLGGYLYNYQSGLMERTGFQFAYVYNFWIHRKTQLSLGLGLTGYHFRIKKEEVDFELDGDPVLDGDLSRGIFVPDASFGAYLLNERYSLGFSAEQILSGTVKNGSSAYGNFEMDRHFYLMGSYSFFAGRENEFRPSVLMKMSEQVRPQMDIGLTYLYDNFKNSFWFGLAYRTTSAMIISMGVRADHLHVGYAFDFSFHEVQRITYGTHEIALAFKFGGPQKRYRWLNRY